MIGCMIIPVSGAANQIRIVALHPLHRFEVFYLNLRSEGETELNAQETES